MRMPSLAALIIAASALLGTSAALANPVTCISGVCVPIGGTYLDNSLSAETLVQNEGDTLSGVFAVTSISNGAFQQTYSYGLNDVYLAGVFTDFTLDNIDTSVAGHTYLQFTGGTLQYYTSGSDNIVTNLGVQNDLDNIVDNGVLWAAFDAIAGINGYTLTIDVVGTPGDFTGASTDFVFLDVVGGDAAAFFDSNTQIDTLGIARDMSFSGTASAFSGSNPCTEDFFVCGANTAKSQILAQDIPEPLTISLFGAGLIGAGALARRRRKALKN